MKAKAILLMNIDDIQTAEKLGLKIPPPNNMEIDFFFNIQTIAWTFVMPDGFIKASVAGREIIFKKEQKTWDKIKLHLE